MLAPDRSAKPEEDWFGDGSSFDSGEELAAALFALAGSVDPVAGGPAPVLAVAAEEGSLTAAIDLADDEPQFEIVHPVGGKGVALPEATRRLEALPETSPAPTTWRVRASSQSALPERRPGK